MTLEIACAVQRGEFRLVADVMVQDGEMLAISGPNGSGKSTLLSVVAGLLATTTGWVRIDDSVVDRAGRGRERVFVQPESRRVGLLAQGGALFSHMSALDNVAFGPRATGESRTDAERRAIEMLDRLGIGDLAQRRPHHMSGGQRQRVALARTLVMSPRVLLLDEPTTSLDRDGRLEVLQVLATVTEHFDGPMVLISHDQRDVEALADRSIEVVQDGRHSRIA